MGCGCENGNNQQLTGLKGTSTNTGLIVFGGIIVVLGITYVVLKATDKKKKH